MDGEASTCDPGAGRCLGSSDLEVCDAHGVWAHEAQCAGACEEHGDQAACTDAGCKPTETECLDARTVRLCGGDARWTPARSCENTACFDGSCQGECSPDEYKCGELGRSEVCDRAGEWRPGGENCAAPDYLCVRESGHCERNYSFFYGAETSEGGQVEQVGDRTLIALRVVVDEDVQVIAIGLHTGESVPVGSRVAYATYADLDGAPSEMVHELRGEQLAPAATNWIDVGTGVFLEAGRAYWLAAHVRTPSAVDMVTFSDVGDAAVTTPYPGNGTPEAFPSAVTATEVRWGIFAHVRRYWH